MPALPAVAKVVRIDIHESMTGNPNTQVRHFFEYGGSLTQADAQTWVNAIGAAWRAQLMPLKVNSCILNNVTLTDLSSASSPQAQDNTVLAGSVNNAALPNGLAMVVKHKIARRYRGGHPRTYLGGLDVTTLASSDLFVSTVASSFLTHWNAFISAALTGVPAAASPATDVSVSYFQGFTNVLFPSGREHPVPSHRASPIVDAIIANAINLTPASQRRRNQTP